MVTCETSDENVGRNVDWSFTVAHPKKDQTPMHFKGRIDSNSMVGIIQDDLQIYPINLTKDMLASVTRQLRAFIPNAN